MVFHVITSIRVFSAATVFLLISTLSCSKQLESSKVYYSNDLAYAKDTKTPFTGRLVDRDDKGAPMRVGHFKNGIKNGLFSSYYANKRLWKKENFLNGKRQGMYLQFHDNGRLKYKIFFEEGHPITALAVYDLDGKPTGTLSYTEAILSD